MTANVPYLKEVTSFIPIPTEIPTLPNRVNRSFFRNVKSRNHINRLFTGERYTFNDKGS